MYEKESSELFTGTRIDKYPSGQIRYLIDYENGIINGKNEGYFKDATLWYLIEFKNGLKDGHYIEYYENKNKEIETFYKNDKENGIRKDYDSDGTLITETYYEDGEYNNIYYEYSGSEGYEIRIITYYEGRGENPNIESFDGYYYTVDMIKYVDLSIEKKVELDDYIRSMKEGN